jgi:hypothetical protein
MDGRVHHQVFYLAVADAIGRPALESLVRQIASVEEIREALHADPHLNNIPLPKWDGMDRAVRTLIAGQPSKIMAISWSAKAASNLRPGTFCWSLSETVCVLKAVARALVEAADQPGDDRPPIDPIAAKWSHVVTALDGPLKGNE